MKSWSKNFWAELVIFFIGVCFVVASLQMSDSLQTTLLSVGCSLIATAVSAFVMDKAQDKTLDDVVAQLKENRTLLGKQQDMLNRFVDLHGPNSRIIRGEHLEEPVKPILGQFIGSDKELNIDVIGFRLKSFWDAHSKNLLDCPKLHLRMIVQNPSAKFFVDMAYNEGYDLKGIKKDIEDQVNIVRELQSKLLPQQQIEIRLLDYPASVTTTRINSMLFVRTRLINQTSLSDNSFFEKYTEGDYPFETFKKYFEEAWTKSTDKFEP